MMVGTILFIINKTNNNDKNPKNNRTFKVWQILYKFL